MGVFIGPRITTSWRMSIVPAAGELIYDTDRQIYFMGDGKTSGGLPLVVDQGGSYSAGGVTGPKGSVQYAIALFDGIRGAKLSSGPAPGKDGTVLMGKGIGTEPAFDTLPLTALSAAGAANDAVIIGPDGKLSLKRIPVSSLAPAGEKGQILTSNGKGTGDTPSYQDPQNGFVPIGPPQTVPRNIAVFETAAGDFTAKYDTYLLIGTNIRPAGVASPLNIYFSSLSPASGKSEWWSATGNLKYLVSSTGAAIAADSIALAGNVGADTGCTVMMYLFNPGVDSLYTTFRIDYATIRLANNKAACSTGFIAGCTAETTAVTGVRFKFGADISSGTFSLYGLDKGRPVTPGGNMQ